MLVVTKDNGRVIAENSEVCAYRVAKRSVPEGSQERKKVHARGRQAASSVGQK